MLSWVEHEKHFITSGPGAHVQKYIFTKGLMMHLTYPCGFVRAFVTGLHNHWMPHFIITLDIGIP